MERTGRDQSRAPGGVSPLTEEVIIAVLLGAIVALRAKAGVVGDSAGKLVAAADGAVRDSFEDLDANGSLRASIGAACAIKELPVTVQALGDSSGSLAAEVEASASVLATVGG